MLGDSARALRSVFANPGLRRIEVARAASAIAVSAYAIVFVVVAYDAGGAAARWARRGRAHVRRLARLADRRNARRPLCAEARHGRRGHGAHRGLARCRRCRRRGTDDRDGRRARSRRVGDRHRVRPGTRGADAVGGANARGSSLRPTSRERRRTAFRPCSARHWAACSLPSPSPKSHSSARPSSRGSRLRPSPGSSSTRLAAERRGHGAAGSAARRSRASARSWQSHGRA